MNYIIVVVVKLKNRVHIFGKISYKSTILLHNSESRYKFKLLSGFIKKIRNYCPFIKILML